MVFGAPHDITRRRAASAGAGSEQDGAGDAGQQEQEEEHVSAAPPLLPAGPFPSSTPSTSAVFTARFPQHAHDWDHAVPIIRELYMVQNLPLPQVIEIMTTKHGFKATARMYKSRFPKWGWAKNEKRKPAERKGSRKARRPARRTEMEQEPSGPGVPAPPTSPADRMMLHESPYARHLYESCRALDAFISSWARQDPRWAGDTLLTSLAVRAIPSHIDTAVSHFAGGDYAQGGKFLRLAFLDVEHCIRDDHVLNIFGLLVEWGLPLTKFPGVNGVEVLLAFSKYVYQQALIHWGNHPITSMSRGLMEASRHGGERVVSWMQSMFRLRINVFKSLRGLDLATLSGQIQFLSEWPDTTMATDFVGNQNRRIRDVRAAHGEDHFLVMREQMALMRIELVQKIPSPDLGDRLERLCAATSRYKRSQDRDREPYAAMKQHSVFRGSHFLLALFRASQADADGMVEACREVIYLDCEPATPWGSFVAFVVDLLREHGQYDEAERIVAWKKSVELPPSLEKLLEQECGAGDEASILGTDMENNGNLKEEGQY